MTYVQLSMPRYSRVIVMVLNIDLPLQNTPEEPSSRLESIFHCSMNRSRGGYPVDPGLIVAYAILSFLGANCFRESRFASQRANHANFPYQLQWHYAVLVIGSCYTQWISVTYAKLAGSLFGLV